MTPKGRVRRPADDLAFPSGWSSPPTVGVKGGPGSFAATAPLTMTIRFPATESCGATSFDVADEACVVKSKGKKLVRK